MQSKRRIDVALTDLSLSDVVSACLAGDIAIDGLARAIYSDPRVKRLIAHACFKFKVPSDAEADITQDLALLLTQKFIKTIVNPEKIYNVLHVSACHIARRKAEKSGEDSLEELIDRSAEYDPDTSSLMYDEHQDPDKLENSIDRRKAIEEFNRRFSHQLQKREDPMFPATDFRMLAFDAPPHIVHSVKRPLKKETANAPSLAGTELNEIRRSLGYSVPEFARLLNTTKTTLASYLYGLVKNVPESIIKEARLLHNQASSELQDLNDRFGNLTMREIANDWIKTLGIDPDDKKCDTLLANALYVDRATVWRWRERDMRPEARKLKEYANLVARVVITKRNSQSQFSAVM
jgi:transcriptional regulator with XRE-family HTH domain